LIENVGKETIHGVILGELLLENEQVVHVVENTIEVGLE
jgi:hypothetical protein